MTREVKSNIKMYGKFTRALLRQLRLNGCQLDARIRTIVRLRAQVLSKLISTARRAADTETKLPIIRLLTGMIGIDDQIQAMMQDTRRLS